MEKCSFRCMYGGCIAGYCDCDESYFGRVCQKKIYKMGGDVLRMSKTFARFQTINIEEFIHVGHMNFNITVSSEQRPKVIIFAAESNRQNRSLFTNFDPRWVEERKSVMINLDLLARTGSQTKILIAQKKWVYISLITFDEADIDFRISSKERWDNHHSSSFFQSKKCFWDILRILDDFTFSLNHSWNFKSRFQI